MSHSDTLADGWGASRPAAGADITRHATPGPTDAEAVLHRVRTLILGGVLLFASVGLAALSDVSEWTPEHLPDAHGLGTAMRYISPLVLAALTLWAARTRPVAANLPRLRAADLLIALCCLTHLTVTRVAVFQTIAALAPGGDANRPLVQFLAYMDNTRGFYFAIAYGLIIPNTWRRCLAVLATVSLVRIAASQAVLWTRYPPLAWEDLLGSSMPAVLACGTSLGATFTVNRLQRELAEANRRMADMGQYRLVRQIGAGGMGEVFLAEHQFLKRLCAVKFIRPEAVASPHAAERFRREVESMARLSHPNIVTVYDYGVTPEGSFYCAMEYVEGDDLQEQVRRHGPVEPVRAMGLLRQLCRAAHVAHEAGLVHRDIKPGNVLLARDAEGAEVVKLLDFGLVSLTRADAPVPGVTLTGAILGTPGYMSPEQACGEPLDRLTDVYSLAAVGYFLLTGRPLFEGKPMNVIAAHITEEPARLEGLPPEWCDCLHAALSRDPAARPATAAEFERRLARLRLPPPAPALP